MTLHTLYFTILDRRIKDRQRKLMRNREDVTDAIPEPIMSAAPEPTLDVERLMALLNAEQRTVISLKFISGLKNTEIAPRIGRTAAEVGQIVFRAMQILRDQWDDSSQD